MPDNMENKDLRRRKTEKTLNAAMLSLLEKRNFRKITVGDICNEALISRATFYAHFADKYDFLKRWIINAWPDNINNSHDTYEVKEQKINQFINENKTLIKNVFVDADNWTIDALFDALCFILRLTTDKTIDEKPNPKYIIHSNFYIGGMVQYIMWQVKNDFPQNVTMFNNYLYKIIKSFQEWS